MLSILLVLCLAAAAALAEPVRLHPNNPHYLLYKGKPLIVVSSGEHYGSIVNLDFDWKKYLDTLHRDGMNYTRIFSGAYIEPAGAFGIARNTLAPASGRFLAPWARSSTPGYKGGGNKFDLDRWDPQYFERLKAFTAYAHRLGILVEMTLFSSTYGDAQWAVHPLHPDNNVNNLQHRTWKDLNTLDNGTTLARQEALVRKIVTELNPYDNVILEIQNEPWADRGVDVEKIDPPPANNQPWAKHVDVADDKSLAWQARIAAVVTETEARLPKRHLIAQNYSNFRARINGIAPGVSIVNFHYAFPEAVTLNYDSGKLLGYDETGFQGRSDDVYRREAWRFLLAGGGAFNHLDYSFSTGREDGTDVEANGPGGGSPALRKQLSVLSRFLHSFDVSALLPSKGLVAGACAGLASALSSRGQLALYLPADVECTLELDLPAAKYRGMWVDPRTGAEHGIQPFSHTGGRVKLSAPPFGPERALRMENR